MIVTFGLLDGSATIYYVILPLFLIMFFYIVYLFGLGFVGGGDIKYLILISMYINHPLKFAWYLIISGILQLLFLLFYQKVKKRRFVPMVPAMFVAVVLCDIWI
jgi:Flp pilus assembly protein protease CpaA